ncbi:signal peptidase I [bacterium]|nr:signal peptidase I [bacterium]
MLAFDSPWWIVSAIALTGALRVWMANLVSLPKWVSWVLVALVPIRVGWRMRVWLNSPMMPVSPPVMVLILIATAVAVLYLFDTDRARKHKPGIIELIDSALIALLLVFCILRPFVIQAFFIPSASMENTLLINDRILVNKFSYFFREPRHGDIIVFRAPPQADPGKKDFIKRVIGVPGDHISVHDGKLWRNGQPVNEPYIRETPLYAWPVVGRDQFATGVLADENDGRRWIVDDHGLRVTVGEVIVPPRAILVMGDNRNDSNDSHAWTDPDTGASAPFVPRENALGKAEVIFYPFPRIRLTR